jgi:streptomycin 6-kinase
MDQPVFPSRWEVSGAELIAETIGSHIWKVVREDGSPAIVKAMKPVHDVEDELRGVHFLRWREGEGAVRLLDIDGHRMLLEYAGDRLLTQTLVDEGDVAATAIAAEVLATIHAQSSRPAPPDLQPLRQRFASLFARAADGSATLADGLYGDGAAMAQILLDDQRDVRPLHGDLHHDNIIHGPRGWLAIDPKGVFGDPAYDAANLFYNPLGHDQLCLDPVRIANMTAVFSEKLQLDPRRLLDHAFAYGCLSAAWHGEDGNDAEEVRELSIAKVVREVRNLSF